MMTQEQLITFVKMCSYPNFTFRTGDLGDGIIVQVSFWADGQEWPGRKWYISPNSTEGEVVQTCFLACVTALEYKARESFTYMGRPLFHLHHRIMDRYIIACQTEEREAQKNPTPPIVYGENYSE